MIARRSLAAKSPVSVTAPKSVAPKRLLMEWKMKPTYQSAGAHTVRARVAASIAVRLHLQYEHDRALWRLSSGPFVPTDVAALVIANAPVAPVGDALISNMPGQTGDTSYD